MLPKINMNVEPRKRVQRAGEVLLFIRRGEPQTRSGMLVAKAPIVRPATGEIDVELN